MKKLRLVSDLFLFFRKAFCKVKTSVLHLRFNIFGQPSTWHTIKINSIRLWPIDPEICSILIFQKSVWEQFLYHILCIIFQEKHFTYQILLTDQILLSDCLYFLRYWSICVLSLFVNQIVTLFVKQIMNFVINLILLIKPFSQMTKKSKQKS